MARECQNWLHTYLDWTLTRSEAPETYIIWTGLVTVASVLKRNVRFPRELLGSYEIYPNLYVILVGPAGGPRKSTTMGYAYELIGGLKKPNLTGVSNIAATAMSASKLVETLSQTDDGSVTILSSEFASFINVSKEEMYDLLTDLYDGKIKHDYATRMHGLEIVKNPCVNLLAATTPSWIASTSDHLTGGGFASRVLFVFEQKVRQRKLYYDNVDWDRMEQLKSALQKDLVRISELKGTFKHDNEQTKNHMEQWYREQAETIIASEQVQGYFQRKHAHVHKVAMILSLMDSDDLIITLDHFNQAKELVESLEANMPRALSAVGKNPHARDLEEIEDFIRSYNGQAVPRSRIVRRFYHNIEPDRVGSLLGALISMGTIQLVSAGKDPAYRSKE